MARRLVASVIVAIKSAANKSTQWLFTEPEKGVFNWTEGEIVSKIAEDQDKILRCHTLVWHSQLAPWVLETEWTAEELTDIITEHVTQVATHWKGRCYAWDVVNEALNEDGTYRESVFYQVLGEEYIKLAFRLASEIDPEAKLYYNDYNIEKPSPKVDGVHRIVRLLQDDGIRIDGVGLQAHFTVGEAPTLDQQIATLDSYGEFGLETAYTELDIRFDKLPPTNASLALQKANYRDVRI
jgi:endo-1,4-beta-xylanase